MPARKRLKGEGPRPPKDGVEEFEVKGHAVLIRSVADPPELWIDGERQAYFTSEGGYTLNRSAYVPPAPTLADAARAYLERGD